MLDLLAFLPVDDLGLSIGARAATLLDDVVQHTPHPHGSLTLSAQASLLLLGFLLGLCSEMRKPH